MKKVITAKPIMTAGASLYPFSEALRDKFTLSSRYGDTINLWKLRGSGDQKRLMLPREICPLGETDSRAAGQDIDFVSSFKARNEHQTEWVYKTTMFLKEGKSGLAEAPTGFGKTVCSCEIIARIGKKTAIVVTKEDARDQWIAAAKMVLGLESKEIGIMQGDTCTTIGKKIVICMIHSISKHERYHAAHFKAFGLVIWDEVHRVGADTFANSAWIFPALLRLGISATPHRKDGKEVVFRYHIGKVLVRTEAMQLIPRIFMQQSSWFVPKTKIKTKEGWDIGPIPHKAGKTMHLHKIMGRNFKRNEMIAKFVGQAYKKGRCIMIFADMIEHLEALQISCRNYGIPQQDMAYYIGGLTPAQRDAAKMKKILFSTYTFTSESTDIPWLDTAVLATPRADVKQIVGRILREWDDKRFPVVYDIADNGSKVFKSYTDSRIKWYKKIGAVITVMKPAA